MNVLIAEDDDLSRLLLTTLLTEWDYNVTAAVDGNEAWKILSEPDHPHLLLLDWSMPGMEGPEIVQKLKQRLPVQPYYAIIITSRNNKNAAASALEAGADDFISKPFDSSELRARVSVGGRTCRLEMAMAQQIIDLNEALSRIKQLEGIVPICSYCKKIRDDEDNWQRLESYISQHSEAQFSHGICPECYKEQMKVIENFDYSKMKK